jgi:hypothetical protein
MDYEIKEEMAMHREIKNSYRILVRNTWPYFKNTTE